MSGMSLTRRISSWGDQGDHLEEPNLHSEDELSESVMLQGAGGVLDEPPNAYQPRAAEDATTTQTSAHLPLHQSQARHLLNHSDIPSVSPPAGSSDPRQRNVRSVYASPLRQDPYSSPESFGDDDDDSIWGDDEANYPLPTSSPEFQRDDDDDSDDEGIVVPPRARPPVQLRPLSTSPPASSQGTSTGL
jgi:hypothetical protein